MSFLTYPQELSRFTSASTLERGRKLWSGGKVLACVLHQDEEDGQPLWFLEGQVQGSQHLPYDVEVDLVFDAAGTTRSFEGRCSCPVGEDCKHAVALALKAGAQNAAPQTVSPAQQVQQWLQRIESLAAPQLPAQGDAMDEQPVYLLRAAAASSANAAPWPRLELSWQMARQLKRGGWGKPRTPSYNAEQRMAPDSLGGQAARLLRALDGVVVSGYYNYQPSPWKSVTGPLGLMALQACARTGHLFLVDAKNTIVSAALAWGEARALAWSWDRAPSDAGQEALWQLRSSLDETVQLFAGTPMLYLDMRTHSCGTVQAQGVDDASLPLLLAAPPLPTSCFSAPSPRLLKQLAPLPWPPGVQAPERWPLCAPVARLSLALTSFGERAKGLVTAALRFDYDGLCGWWSEREACVLTQDPSGRSVLLTRDLAAEAVAAARLNTLGLGRDGQGFYYQGDTSIWLDWAVQDWEPLREAGFVLELAPGVQDLVQTVDVLHISLSGANDEENDAGNAQSDAESPSWFDLRLGIDLGGERIDVLPWLPSWLGQLQSTPDGPVLPQWLWREQEHGRWLRLPSAPLQPWLNALLELVGEHGLGDGRLSRMEALRLAAGLGEGLQWEGAAQLRGMLGQLLGAGVLPEVAVPEGLQAELRPYQRHGLNWLQFLRAHSLGGVLADDMGLGKTLQTLAHLLHEKEAGRMDRPSLVIVPVSLLGNWRGEAARFAPSLRCQVWHGAQRHEADFAEDCDVLLAPYSLLQRDRERWLAQRWHIVVLDEAQHIKNASTHAAQVVAGLDARQRIALSGTPLENHLGELWSLFHFLMPGFLGSVKRFGELFRIPIEKQGDTEALARLRQRVTPFMLRRTKTAVAAELPPLTESVVRVALSSKQADLYETIRLTTEKAVRQALSERGLARSQIQVLDALLKLRQVCCAPRLIKTEAAQKLKTSAKLELLMELLLPLLEEGRRVLLFSQFTSMLTLIEAELAQAGLRWTKLTGQTQKRAQAIERFTSGEVPLFLISLKAGGTGLNLQQADTVIHYDPWWNPAVEAQATGRAHRIGQTRQVMVYKLVAEGTIEERILALQERKAALAQGLLTGSAARDQPLFTESDVAELLKPLGD